MGYRIIYIVSFVILAHCKSLGVKKKMPIDSFTSKFISSKKKLPEKDFDKNLVPYLKQFIQDARKNSQLEESLVQKLRKLKLVDRFSKSQGGGIVASCSSHYVLLNDDVEGNLLKPANYWLEIELLNKQFPMEKEQNRDKLRFDIYHVLFHCFYRKGHLPDGYEGIMEANFYDPDEALVKKSPESLIRELFSKETFDIIESVQ